LRRVFERLINGRFVEFKDVEGWSDADFVGKRMDEKIEILKGHLPSFLVRNRKVYSILSKGIHDLEEPECLNAFEVLKHSIFFILDEDERKRQELQLRGSNALLSPLRPAGTVSGCRAGLEHAASRLTLSTHRA